MRLWVGILATGLLALGIARNAWPWIVDDAFISLRYAERLVSGHGLTWTDGERVEGYSNLLWVLLTAALGWLGLDWILAVRLLGVACTVATFAVLLRTDLLPSSLPARLAVAILAALATTSVWAIGGLESPLLMLLVTAAMAGLHRGLHLTKGDWRPPLLSAGLALALACWTRPDGPLWAVLLAGTVLVVGGRNQQRGTRWQRLGWIAAPALAAVLLQSTFRLVYYGDWLPNTGRAKVAVSAESRRVGLLYALSAAEAMRALLLPAALGLLALLRREARALLLFALTGTIVWWLYVVQMGGDAFPHSRLLVPTLGPLTVLAAHGLDVVRTRGRVGALLATTIAVAAIVLARIDAVTATDDQRQQLSAWEWPAIAIGEWLGRAFVDEQPLIAVDAAGAVPFASRLPSLDMLGLCDRTIATTPVPPGQAFVPGHARANGTYVLSRQPDLVMFGLPPGSPQPQWPGGWQMEASPQFHRDYRLLLLQTGEQQLGDGSWRDQRITLWARLEGRVGVTREHGAVRVPGYWLGSYRQPYSFSVAARPESGNSAQLARDIQDSADWWLAARVVAVLADDGTVVGEVRGSGELRLRALALAAGTYRVSAGDLPAGVEMLLAADKVPVTPRGDTFEVGAANGADPHVDLVCSVPKDTALPFRIATITIEPAR